MKVGTYARSANPALEKLSSHIEISNPSGFVNRMVTTMSQFRLHVRIP